MKFNRVKALKVIAALLIIFSMAVNIKKLKKEVRAFRNNTKDVTVQYEEKFKPIRKLLPSRVNIGYKNDEKDFEKSFESIYLTQYALSPNKILNNEISDYTIAGFNNPSAKAAFIKENKLSLVKNIDNKMALYKRNLQ